MSEKQNKIIKEGEIDIIELAKVLWSKKKFIAIVTVIFCAFGILIVSMSEDKYEASAKLLLQNSQSNNMNLNALSGLSRFFSSTTTSEKDGFQLTLYPEIVKSTPFVEKLLNTPIFFKNQDTIVTSSVYFSEIEEPSIFTRIYSTITSPFTKKNAVKNIYEYDHTQKGYIKDIKYYSVKEWSLIERFRNFLSIEVDDQNATISISIELPDAIAAAQLTSLFIQELTSYVTRHKLKKAKENLIFIKNRFDEIKKVYEEKQKKVAKFIYENRNITNPVFEVEHEKLQNEMNIAFEVYKNMATQLEQAKLKVKEESPVFSVVEPVSVPLHEIKSTKNLITLATTMAGIFISVTIVLFRNVRMK